MQTKKVQKNSRHGAMALLEFDTVAAGMLASDMMLKRSPIALIRCGSIHPGRYLVLVGGSVASTEEAYMAGVQVGEIDNSLSDSIFLGDIHPCLHDAVLGKRQDLCGDALAVVETRSSPALLAAVDAAVKSTPVRLTEIRLADDLGGHALALMSGELSDIEIALEICTEKTGDQLIDRKLLSRLDAGFRTVLDQGTRFGQCQVFEPADAEYPTEVACSWDA